MTPYDPDGYGYDDLYYEHDSYERFAVWCCMIRLVASF